MPWAFSDSVGIRTRDPYIKSVLLYQLSYRIKPVFQKRGANIYALTKTKTVFF